MSAELRDRCAIVTGASSGIGAATARALAARGARLVLSARREDRLRALADEIAVGGGEVAWMPADMRVETDVIGVVEQARKRFGGVDVLINNAGLGFSAPVRTGETEQWRTMLEVNVLGLLIASREAIRDMERRDVAGHVVHVSSMAAHRVPGVASAVYAATKHAVRAITEGMRQELRAVKSPIRVTAVSPGYVETEFAEVFSGSRDAADALHRSMKVLEADDIADAIAWIVTRPPHVQVHDVLMRATEQPG